jgi:CSLREA domain-containing protein
MRRALSSATEALHAPPLQGRAPPGRFTVFLLVGVITVVLPCVSVASAPAATLKVTTRADELVSHDGKCSLREAIAAVDSPGMASDCGVAARGSNTIALGAGRYELAITPKRRDDNSSGDLDVTRGARVTIRGAGQLATVIDAAALGDRVLRVFNRADATLSRLTISGGHPPGGSGGSAGSGKTCPEGGAGANGSGAGRAGEGGGIFNSGTLTLKRVVVTDNTAGAGGAGGEGESQDTASGCSGGAGGAGGSGGGIYNDGKLALAASTIAANNAGAGGSGGAGGGSSVDTGGSGGSGGAGGRGGGIYNRGTLSVIASTISHNNAGIGGAGGPGGSGAVTGAAGGDGGSGGSGGGIFTMAGRLRIVNSTLFANFAGGGGAAGGPVGSGGAGGSGGAVRATAGASALRNATVANNGVGAGGAGGPSGGSGGVTGSGGGLSVESPARAGALRLQGGRGGLSVESPAPAGALRLQGSGGGLSVESPAPAGALRLQNTIVASSVGSACASNTPSAIVNGGHDLSYGDASCPGTRGDPELGPLSNYGGPTETLALGTGSAAIDRVPTSRAGCPATDQRGVRRPQGERCDIGAFEFATPTVKIIAPDGRADYPVGQRTVARFSCSEGGIFSPILSCDGTVPSGHAVNTRSPGVQRFTVTAVDATGQEVTNHLHYTVLPYTNPMQDVHRLVPGRIDMGVDYGGWGKILALGAGKVIRASDHDRGWPDGGWILYQLSEGPFAGKYVYVAENITTTVRTGQSIRAGQVIARLHATWPHMETGWASGRGDSTLAELDEHQCPCGDPGGWSSIEGRNFNRLLVVLGAPSGYVQPDPPHQHMPPGWPPLHSAASARSIPLSPSPRMEGWIRESP